MVFDEPHHRDIKRRERGWRHTQLPQREEHRDCIGESGSVTIATTTYKDITATLTFHPTDKLVQDGFKFENGSVTKTYGDEDFTLATTGEVEGSTVTYESSAPAVATVDGTGKVTIKGAGTAVITAKASATEEYAEAAATCT